jgi:hypothetical protein
MDTIEIILKREFPELEVDVPSLPGTGDIQQDELSKALQYIRKNRLIQDSQTVLSSSEPMRDSVIYPVIFPEQSRKLNFKVHWIQGPMLFVGYIQTQNHVGDDIPQARLYGMRIR